MKEKIRIHMLAVKYYPQGDSWREAKGMATSIVKGFRKC